MATTRPELTSAIAQLAVLIALSEDALIEAIHRLVEVEGVSRRQALRQVLCADGRPRKGNLVAAALRQQGRLAAAVSRSLERRPAKQRRQAGRLESLALRRARPVSSLHVLTTESAGMTEGYVQSWLEEEMALFNTVNAHGLEAEGLHPEPAQGRLVAAAHGDLLDAQHAERSVHPGSSTMPKGAG